MTQHLPAKQFTQRRSSLLTTFTLTLFGLSVLGAPAVFAQDSSKNLRAFSCFIRTYEEADIPALERGLITKIAFEEGEIVDAATVLAILDDADARIDVAISEIEVELARKQLEESYALQIAQAKVKETEQLIEQSRIEQDIARKTANSNIEVLQARKALDVAQADLDRASNARNDFAGSVSDAEYFRLRYLRDRSQLDIQGAEEKKTIAALEAQVEQSAVATAEAILERQRYEQSQTGTDQEIRKLDLQRLTLHLQRAKIQLQRRTIIAPFTGMIVEKYHHRGEWMEPGEPIFRIVRLDQLIVEGYANANEVHHSMRGTTVLVQPSADLVDKPIRGQLTYVSPEIDPVNQQVQIRAIIDNSAGVLRAGQAVEMTIVRP